MTKLGDRFAQINNNKQNTNTNQKAFRATRINKPGQRNTNQNTNQNRRPTNQNNNQNNRRQNNVQNRRPNTQNNQNRRPNNQNNQNRRQPLKGKRPQNKTQPKKQVTQSDLDKEIDNYWFQAGKGPNPEIASLDREMDDYFKNRKNEEENTTTA